MLALLLLCLGLQHHSSAGRQHCRLETASTGRGIAESDSSRLPPRCELNGSLQSNIFRSLVCDGRDDFISGHCDATVAGDHAGTSFRCGWADDVQSRVRELRTHRRTHTDGTDQGAPGHRPTFCCCSTDTRSRGHSVGVGSRPQIRQGKGVGKAHVSKVAPCGERVCRCAMQRQASALVLFFRAAALP